jgi:hypothetical protein
MSALALARSVRRLPLSDWLVHRSCVVHETAINSFFSANPNAITLGLEEKEVLYIFSQRSFLFSATPIPPSVHTSPCLYSSLSSQVFGLANICVEMLNLKSSHRFAD